MIEVQGLSKLYGSFKALDNVSFAINEGEIVGLWVIMALEKPQP
ncbi:MAG: hypothetical protein R2865_09755 [Deinococcales bacterium]